MNTNEVGGKRNGKSEAPSRHCCVCNTTLWDHHKCDTCGEGVCYKPGDDNACCKEMQHNEVGATFTLKHCSTCASKMAVVDGATPLMSEARERRDARPVAKTPKPARNVHKSSVALEKGLPATTPAAASIVKVSKTSARDRLFAWRTNDEQPGLSAENVVRMQPLFKKLSSVAESLLSSDHWPPEHSVLVWAGNNMRTACTNLLFSINDDDGPVLEPTVRSLMEWISRPSDGSSNADHRLCDLTEDSLRGRMHDLLASFAESIGPDAGPEVK